MSGHENLIDEEQWVDMFPEREKNTSPPSLQAFWYLDENHQVTKCICCYLTFWRQKQMGAGLGRVLDKSAGLKPTPGGCLRKSSDYWAGHPPAQATALQKHFGANPSS